MGRQFLDVHDVGAVEHTQPDDLVVASSTSDITARPCPASGATPAPLAELEQVQPSR